MPINNIIKPDSPQEIKDAQVSQSLQEIDNKFLTNIIKDETGTPRVLIGKQQDGFGSGKNHGIKVSQAGSDVTTATEDQLIMSSQFNMLKIVATGTIDVNASSATGTYTETYTHGLGYTPGHLIYVKTPTFGSGTWMTTPYIEAGPQSGEQHLGTATYTWADATNVNFRVALLNSAGATGIYTFKYYLFKETAAG